MSFYAGKPGLDVTLGKMRGVLRPGAGIDISAGTISTTGEAGVPYVGGTGIYIHGATVEADLDPGYRMEINGSTIGQLRYMPIETVTGSSVTLQAGHAYKIYATSAAVTLNTETIPADSFGLEGHLEIYVAGTGYVITGTNVVLANALEPDSVNNLTARFHDGICILSVEDHVAGYIVTVNAASGAGSLAYGLSTSTNEYIAVDASLNGQTLDLAGVTTYAGEKHIVGNGPEETIIAGSINCTSKTTVANLSLQDVTITGGTMTLGDAFIPSGSTVAVSGGGLAVEKVTGAGAESVIDLGGTDVSVPNATKSFASGCTFTNGAGDSGGAFYVSGGTATFENVTFSGNSATSGGAVYNIVGNATFSNCTFSGNIATIGGAYAGRYTGVTGLTMSDCVVTGNSATDFPPGVTGSNGVFVNTTISGNVTEKTSKGKDLFIAGGACYITDCTLGDVSIEGGGVAVIAGQNNKIDYFRAFYVGSAYRGGIVISSGASIQLTYLMEPGDGITVLTGGATVNGNFIGSVDSDTVYTSIDSTGTPT